MCRGAAQRQPLRSIAKVQPRQSPSLRHASKQVDTHVVSMLGSQDMLQNNRVCPHNVQHRPNQSVLLASPSCLPSLTGTLLTAKRTESFFTWPCNSAGTSKTIVCSPPPPVPALIPVPPPTTWPTAPWTLPPLAWPPRCLRPMLSPVSSSKRTSYSFGFTARVFGGTVELGERGGDETCGSQGRWHHGVGREG